MLWRKSLENYSEKSQFMQIMQKILENISHNWVQKIACIALSLIVVQIYNGSLLEKRYISVPLEYKYPDSLISSTILPRTVRASMRGESSIINSIRDEDIIARVDASYIKMEGEHSIPIQFIKNNPLLQGQSIEMQAEPQEVSMKLERKMQKTVNVKLAMDGVLPEDFFLASSTIEPAKINIEGPASRIEKIDMLTTEPVQVNNRTASFEGVAQVINADSLITFQGQSSVQYKIEVKEREIERTFQDVNILVRNLDRNLEIATGIQKGEITLSATKSILDAFLRPPRDMLYIDLKSIQGEAGEYSTIPVQASKLNGISIKSYRPRSLHLIIKEKTENEE